MRSRRCLLYDYQVIKGLMKAILIDAEFNIAKSLGALTLRKPIERKIITDTIKQMQNLAILGICILSLY